MRYGFADTQGTHGWSRTRKHDLETRGVLQTKAQGSSERVGSFHGTADLLERAAALALLVLAVPLLVALALWILAADGRPVLYRGERLGLRKRVFHMYKLRTLRRGADQKTADRLLTPGDRLEIPGGRFLRETRLDELPQLWSILRGDMGFIGPRPERPQVYRVHCCTIPGYERRFDVRPGMIGPSQLFTPHATPKRIRAWLDNTWGREHRHAGVCMALTAYTALVVAGKVARRGVEVAQRSLLRGGVCFYREKRRFRRVRPRGARVLLAPLDSVGAVTLAPLLDLNEEALLVRSCSSLPEGTRARARLEIELAGGNGGRKLRSADCEVIVVQSRSRGEGHALVLEYAPTSDRSRYVLHQYFLRNSLASPRPRPAAPA